MSTNSEYTPAGKFITIFFTVAALGILGVALYLGGITIRNAVTKPTKWPAVQELQELQKNQK